MSYNTLKTKREHIEHLLSRRTSVLGVQIWLTDPALVKIVLEMFCFCIRIVCVSSELLPAAERPTICITGMKSLQCAIANAIVCTQFCVWRLTKEIYLRSDRKAT